MVVVHDAELLAKANDSTSTTALQLVLESLKKVLTVGSATGRGATNISSEDLAGELTIVESSAAILVVQSVKCIQILTVTTNKN